MEDLYRWLNKKLKLYGVEITVSYWDNVVHQLSCCYYTMSSLIGSHVYILPRTDYLVMYLSVKGKKEGEKCFLYADPNLYENVFNSIKDWRDRV